VNRSSGAWVRCAFLQLTEYQGRAHAPELREHALVRPKQPSRLTQRADFEVAKGNVFVNHWFAWETKDPVANDVLLDFVGATGNV
jgi:hypothetical protein